MSVPTIALRPPVIMPPKRKRPEAPNTCTSCGYVLSPTGECIGCSE